MLENIAIEIAEELNNAGINAVTAFNASELEDVSAFVCVGLKSARISSSGLGVTLNNSISSKEKESDAGISTTIVPIFPFICLKWGIFAHFWRTYPIASIYMFALANSRLA